MPANADRKLRPDRIIPWDDFGAHQTPVWDAVMESDFVSEIHFTSLHTLEEDGEQLHRRKLSSELDVRYFVQFAIDGSTPESPSAGNGEIREPWQHAEPG
ncbi:uncharacterized protein PV06_04138 [Exophiala oligosperma]|uniref:Uncharacterized protein n=1 Tax=Exophiala oligosperma TaxID=215243 RepID=A0A0D2DS08_9EURO|nr:uncharacterized protein PV06_04138 [Exophiala oligosperma]KIW45783.1 hypothetical protein PV06_04138 [Exophiala oligosperma]